MVFAANDESPAEDVYVVRDRATGLDAVIVLHSTVLGPAAGGCRFDSYPSGVEQTRDAMRLAEGMSYKNALAGLPLGGGKTVIRRPAVAFDRAALFRAFGRAVEHLGGRYVTAEDVGTSVADMSAVAKSTRYVAGLTARPVHAKGDPSPWTARGVLLSMRLTAERQLGKPLSDCIVAIQGVGHVGAPLARMLHAEGARLVIADTDSAAVARVATETGALVAPTSRILTAPVDTVAPCAMGGVLDATTVRTMAARVVCGAANNQLSTSASAALLADRGILYAPDYVVNAGGIINVAAEYLGWSVNEAFWRVEATAERLLEVLVRAEDRGQTTVDAANALARDSIARRVRPAPLAA